MKLGAVIAAAVVAVGVGQAEAETVANYDLWLRYEGTAFGDLYYASTDGTVNEHYEGYTDPKNMPAGTASYLFGNLRIGDVIRAVVQIVHPDVPVQYDPYYGNGGRTPVCQIGAWDCTGTNYTILQDDGFFAANDDVWNFTLKPVLGSSLSVSFWGGGHADFPVLSDDGMYEYWFDYTDDTFTIVDQPAPVPLPMAGTLLPVGIGALAMMRKRRKSGQAGTV